MPRYLEVNVVPIFEVCNLVYRQYFFLRKSFIKPFDIFDKQLILVKKAKKKAIEIKISIAFIKKDSVFGSSVAKASTFYSFPGICS